jgi:ATP-binding cassette subfamily B protein RaxB
MAVILPDIMAMPMPFNTLLGDMGRVLSGGQKQLVPLAHALCKRPAILFVDEATNHLNIAKAQQANGRSRH